MLLYFGPSILSVMRAIHFDAPTQCHCCYYIEQSSQHTILYHTHNFPSTKTGRINGNTGEKDTLNGMNFQVIKQQLFIFVCVCVVYVQVGAVYFMTIFV